MHIPELLKSTFGGFSPKRVGYALAITSFAFVPAHFYVPCEVSGLMSGFGIILFLATTVLSFIGSSRHAESFSSSGVRFHR